MSTFTDICDHSVSPACLDVPTFIHMEDFSLCPALSLLTNFPSLCPLPFLVSLDTSSTARTVSPILLWRSLWSLSEVFYAASPCLSPVSVVGMQTGAALIKSMWCFHQKFCLDLSFDLLYHFIPHYRYACPFMIIFYITNVRAR